MSRLARSHLRLDVADYRDRRTNGHVVDRVARLHINEYNCTGSRDPGIGTVRPRTLSEVRRHWIPGRSTSGGVKREA